ncbi:MAG: MarR family winged helix-turn-helix transcriptional regulator [Candidatus Onthomonas sp.]
MPDRTPSGLLIKRIHDRLEKHSNNALRGKDLTMMQMAVLMTLLESPEQQLPMKELERHFSIAQSTAAGIISRLEQKGLVEAFGDPSDRRIKVAHITPAGEVCCAEAACHMEEAEAALVRGFSPEERETFNALLARAAENME